MHTTLYDVFRALLGIACLIFVGYLLCDNRRRIDWRLVVSGIILQFVIAFVVIKVPIVRNGFEFISNFFIELLNFARQGSEFLFGRLMDPDTMGFIFAFQVLPTIIFFSALTSALYYLNILQYIVFAFAWVMHKTMRLSGVESLATAANIFVGQTEAPLVIKPYLEKMTRSEVMALMTGGMATIAGAVLVAYVSILGNNDPELMRYYATHLLIASIISAPAALLTAKLMVPQTEEVDLELFIPRHKMGGNLLDAIATGTTEGVKLAVNVAAMLLVFTAFIALLNYIFKDMIGEATGLNEMISEWSNGRYNGLSLQFILGLLMAPVAWIMGVPNSDLILVGQLLGERTMLNEFYAYVSFDNLKDTGVITSEKSILILTYALCGFANFASIGIQIGGISALAPGKRMMLAQLGLKSMVGGTIACFITGCIAGLLI